MSNMKQVKELTRKGCMIDKEAAEVLTEQDVRNIKEMSTLPMYVTTTLLEYVRTGEKQKAKFTEIKVNKEIPEFTSVTGETYNLEVGNTVCIPEPNAEILVNRGNAEYSKF